MSSGVFNMVDNQVRQFVRHFGPSLRGSGARGGGQSIDGRLYFHDEGEGGATKQIILSVKSGHVNVTHIRDLHGVIEREKAEIGVLLTLEDATKPMRTEAAAAGIYKSPWGKRGSEELHYPRLQILTIAELLEGKGIDYPHMSNVTFKRAPRAETPQPEQLTLNAAPETTKPRKPRK
ncbi:MAG: restriction endonuclease [Candidatus Acidiferrales bacterium]